MPRQESQNVVLPGRTGTELRMLDVHNSIPINYNNVLNALLICHTRWGSLSSTSIAA